jgi:MoxR-like ATPase
VSLTPVEILQARREAMQIPLTSKTKETLKAILSELATAGIIIGDRRARQAVSVAKASAYMSGATQVDPEHLEPLSHVLWAEPQEQPYKAAAIVMKKCNPSAAKINKLLGEAEEIVQGVDVKQTDKVIEAIKKLNVIGDELGSIKESERRDAALEFVQEHAKNLKIAATESFGI